MKLNRYVLVLVLLIVFTSSVFSDKATCLQTQEYYFGLTDGRMHSAWGWGLIGFGLTTIGGIIAPLAEFQGWYPYEIDEYGLIYLVGPSIGAAISLALPLFIKPQPKESPNSISEEKRECYFDGYQLTARRKNLTSALIGCAVGYFCSFTVIPFIAAVYTFSSVSMW